MSTTRLMERMADRAQRMELAEASAGAALSGNDDGYIALTDSAFEIIRENLKRQPISLDLFDTVKSPSGGSTVFSVPGLTGDEAERELTGIVLDYSTPRAYWDSPDPVEGTPPTCMSADSIISNDGKACLRCPFNDFGSKDGESNAKACKESVLLVLLRPNSILPLLVRVPVTSKKRFLRYTTRLAGALTPVNSVVTRITLERATSKGGKPYALFKFEALRKLDPQEAAGASAYAQQFTELLSVAEMAPVLADAG